MAVHKTMKMLIPLHYLQELLRLLPAMIAHHLTITSQIVVHPQVLEAIFSEQVTFLWQSQCQLTYTR